VTAEVRPVGLLEGKVAVVTGSASGIGRATAKLMAREGAKVVVADINDGGAEQVAVDIRAGGGDAIAVATDVSREADVRAMVAAAVDTFGALHVLHNNAAITSADHLALDGTVVDMELDVWDRTFSVALRGAMLGCKHAVPRMIEAGGGSIVNTSSNSGLSGDLTLTAYSAAKAGINSLTLSVATAFGKQGVRCNAIAPGYIQTEASVAVPQELLGVFVSNNLLPRVGEPDDIANAVAFLASDRASFVTGQIIKVDGGQLSHLPHFAYLLDSGLTTTKTDESATS
jgi:NAD(P)-dependent dehydrogenase (short-subunit alcohol dehydrogenase family)